jgi:hypothetical protein
LPWDQALAFALATGADGAPRFHISTMGLAMKIDE